MGNREALVKYLVDRGFDEVDAEDLPTEILEAMVEHDLELDCAS